MCKIIIKFVPIWHFYCTMFGGLLFYQTQCRATDSWSKRFYARQQNASCVLAMAWPFVCLSHSAALLKRCKLVSRNFHCRLPKDSSFSWRHFEPPGDEVPLERGREKSTPWKFLFYRCWLVWRKKRLHIGTHMVLNITSTSDELFVAINIDDIERPWTPKIRGFRKKIAIWGCNRHFKSELHLNGWR